MLARRTLLCAALALAGCGGSGAAAQSPPARVPGRTEVAYLGTLHAPHLTSEQFSLGFIERVVRRVQPDVVLVEIPPDRFESAVSEVLELGERASKQTIRHDWVSSFPELYGAVIPLSRELGYELVPVSGWRPEVSRDRKAYFDAHPDGPDSERYREAKAAYDRAMKQHRASENPRWLNGPEYVELARRYRTAFADAADDQLGAAAVRAINAAHAEHVLRAVKQHRGARILLVFGARHRWYIEPRVLALSEVTYLDVRRFM